MRYYGWTAAPEEYKKLAEQCCDADPDKRPDALTLFGDMEKLLYLKVDEGKPKSNIWDIIYYNDVKLLSRLEKESKY